MTDLGVSPSGSGWSGKPQAGSRLGHTATIPNAATNWPRTRAAITRLKTAIGDLGALRMLKRHGATMRADRVIRRKSDGSWWVAGSPQSLGYAMTGLFRREAQFHFYRLREWRGVFVASRKTFWRAREGEFDLLITAPFYVLSPWSEFMECQKIDRAIASTTN